MTAKEKQSASRATKKSKRAPNYLEKSEILNVRVTPTTRKLLKEAAQSSGRTDSAECEFQLQRALVAMGEGPTHAIMTVLGQSIDKLIRMRVRGGRDWSRQKVEDREVDTVGAGKWIPAKGAHWLNDPYLFAMARQTVLAMFEMFKPLGEPPQELKELIDSGGQRQGAFSIESVLREIQTVDASIPFAKQNRRQRWLMMLKADLGGLADQPEIWGRTGEQARELHALFGKDLLKELISLSRQASRCPEGMTAEQYQQLTPTELVTRNLTPEQGERLYKLRRKIDEIRDEILT